MSFNKYSTLHGRLLNGARVQGCPMSHRRAHVRIVGQPVAEGRVTIESSKMTFIVRLTRDKAGRITGIVEQVRTGLKVRVEGLDAVSSAIGEMISARGHTTSTTRLKQEVRDDA